MKDKIVEMLNKGLSDLVSKTSSREIEEVRVKYLGKSGELTAILKDMKNYEPEQRKEIGAIVNSARKELEDKIAEYKAKFEQEEMDKKLKEDAIDVTMPAKNVRIGALNPITIVQNKIINIFKDLGFDIYDGPEIDFYEYNFDKLNIPADHPARESQDTFYIDDKRLLRSQTSTMQIRVMENSKPPIKMISTGKVYRGDELDASHSPIFYQLEALVIDKNVTLADLKGTLDYLAKSLFGSDVSIRMRPSFFPFTEPSVEVDITCSKCKGKGCPTCKNSGWVEILGAGMVNPKVLDNCGIDSKVYSGFALGIGIERVVLGLSEISDIRILVENDVRTLNQYK
ncbi:MAG: phenylalanine--tRNA ligase subunit alpha [Clostridia bacterium]|nr:phenylalanine--tRNA ligase subunit alpha [Clostridia bacterium]